MTCAKQEFCIHEKYCQRHIGQNFDGCILFSRHLFSQDNKSMTNEEWFSSLPIEEKAKEIYKIAKDDFKELRKLFYGVANDDCDAIALWLKQPHREG